jgi:hypothetical protein
LLGQKEAEIGPEHYHMRAAQMLKLAVEVPDEELRNTLLGLAASWEKLAQQAEKPHPEIDLAVPSVGGGEDESVLDRR